MGRSLLVVHHSPSAAIAAMTEAVVEGANQPDLATVTVRLVSALAATTTDVLDADGYLLGTPTNFGYMSGALKHFFDTTYEDCLDHTAGRPFGLFVHGRTDATGAVSSVERIVTGLRWRQVTDHVVSLGDPVDELDACWNLGATVAAHLATNQ